MEFMDTVERKKGAQRVGGTQRRSPPTHIEITFSAIQSTLRSLEFILSGAMKFVSVQSSQGNLSLSKLQGLQYYFPENFRCNLKYYEMEKFSDSSLHHIFESENFGLPFFTKNNLTWRVKCEKLNFRKSQGIYQISLENCTRIERSLKIFSRPQVIENSRQCLLLRTVF